MLELFLDKAGKQLLVSRASTTRLDRLNVHQGDRGVEVPLWLLDRPESEGTAMVPSPLGDAFSAIVIAVRSKDDLTEASLLFSVSDFEAAHPKASRVGTFTGQPSADQTISAGGKTYKFVSALVTANDVLIGASLAATIANLAAAINAGAGIGTTYGTGTTANALVSAAAAATTIAVTALAGGPAGNEIELSEVSAAFTWAGAKLTGGAWGAYWGVLNANTEPLATKFTAGGPKKAALDALVDITFLSEDGETQETPIEHYPCTIRRDLYQGPVDDMVPANPEYPLLENPALAAALALLAPKASPALTGTPTAPTAAEGTNTTHLATTAFVTGSLAGKQDASAILAALAGLTIAANQLPYGTGADTLGLADFTAFGRSLVACLDEAALVTQLGLIIDNDGTFAAPSSGKLPTTAAVKTYTDALLAANDAMVFKGVINCSAAPDYPLADCGHTYRVSLGGIIGGEFGFAVASGDLLTCLADATPAGNQASVGTNWVVVKTNVDGMVTGPVSATSGHLVVFGDGTGKQLSDSGIDPADLALRSDLVTFAMPTVSPAAGLVDFLASPNQKLNVTTDLVLTGTNYTDGRAVTLVLRNNDSVDHTIEYPGSWLPIGGPLITVIPISVKILLRLSCTGMSESDVTVETFVQATDLGELVLGKNGTSTRIVGSATDNRVITMPDKNGTVVVVDPGDSLFASSPAFNVSDNTRGYYMDGVRVVGLQQPALANTMDAGASAEHDARINEILDVLRAHGLIAT